MERISVHKNGKWYVTATRSEIGGWADGVNLQWSVNDIQAYCLDDTIPWAKNFDPRHAQFQVILTSSSVICELLAGIPTVLLVGHAVVCALIWQLQQDLTISLQVCILPLRTSVVSQHGCCVQRCVNPGKYELSITAHLFQVFLAFSGMCSILGPRIASSL